MEFFELYSGPLLLFLIPIFAIAILLLLSFYFAIVALLLQLIKNVVAPRWRVTFITVPWLGIGEYRAVERDDGVLESEDGIEARSEIGVPESKAEEGLPGKMSSWQR